jgi:thiamine-phosphate pyrophosphorylase
VRTLSGGVYAITDRTQVQRPLPEIVEAAFSAGFAGVMLREKDLPGGQLLDLATRVADVCRAFDRPLIVNDRLDVALAVPGAGAHVGARGMKIADARRLLGPERCLGYSAHEVNEALSALQDGADYVTLSPIFSSASKPDVKPRGLALLEEGRRTLPEGRLLALGGIGASNIGSVRRAGAFGALVMGALMRADHPKAAAREIVAGWDSEANTEDQDR